MREIQTALLKMIGDLFVKIGYGERGMEARETLNKSSIGWGLLWLILICVWFPAMLICLAEPEFSLSTFLGVMFIFPFPYLFWVICARISVPSLCKKAEAEEERQRQEEEKRQEEYNKAHGISSWQKLVDY